MNFLKIYLEGRKIPSLSWIDETKQIWQLPWKIHRPTVWGNPDAQLLFAWAVYKYNYTGGEPSKEKLRKWKENLRNSILACPYIKELEDRHEQKRAQPFKVYQFVDRKSRKFDVNNNTPQAHQESLQDNPIYQNLSCDRASQFNVPNFSVLTTPSNLQQVPTAGRNSPFTNGSSSDSQDYSDESPGPCLDSEEMFENLTFLNTEVDGLHLDTSNSSKGGAGFDSQFYDFQGQDRSLTHPMHSQNRTDKTGKGETYDSSQMSLRSRSPIRCKLGSIDDLQEPDYNTIFPCNDFVTIRDEIRNNGMDPFQAVKSQTLTTKCSLQGNSATGLDKTPDESLPDELDVLPLSISVSYLSEQVMQRPTHEKFKLCYVESDAMRGSILECPTSAQFGPSDAFLEELPHPSNSNHARIISKILNNMKRGITVSCSNGDIFATRYCKAIANFRTQDGPTLKLDRDKEVKIFDFQKFKTEIGSARWSSLTSDVKINFGVKSSPIEVVSVTITHKQAQKMLQEKKTFELEYFKSPECSLSNEFDRRLSIEQKLRSIHTTHV